MNLNKPIIITILFCFVIGFIVVVLFEKILKHYNLWKVNKIIKDIKAGDVENASLEDPKYGIIEIVKNGFNFSNSAESEKVVIFWENIIEIQTFKRDLGTTDLICLGLITDDNMILEVHEEMMGFKKLCESMLNEFNEISNSWYWDVAHPAFETNLRTLWKKDK